MSEAAKKKRLPRKRDVPALKRDESQGRAKEEKRSESEDIERAVYDGMQDLRVEKPK